MKIRSFQGALISPGLGEALRREDIGEGESAFLEELLPEEIDLPTKTSVGGVSHRSGSEPVRGVRHSHQSQIADIFLSHFRRTACEI